MENYSKIQNPKLREFYEKGQAYIAKMKGSGSSPSFAISPGGPEWASWMRYFDWLGARPYALKLVEWGQLPSITVPAQWPEWFDNNFATGAKPSTPTKPVHRPWVSPSARAEAEMAGRVVLHDGVSFDEFKAMAKARQIPAGSVYVAILGRVYAARADRRAEAA